MSKYQIDSIIDVSKYDSLSQDLFKSKAEYDFKLGNSSLTLASDNEIITHFNKNREKFEQLKEDFVTNYVSKGGFSFDFKNDEKIKGQMSFNISEAIDLFLQK